MAPVVTVNLDELTTGLSKENGVYFSGAGNGKAKVSYPEDGLRKLFEIEENSYWFQHRNRCIVHFAKKYSVSGIFLDVGGGNGVVSKALQDNGFESIVVEPDQTGCHNSFLRGVKNVFLGSLEELPLLPEVEIGSIGAFDVIEHIEDDLGILQKMHSVLSDEGFLYLCVPAFNSLWSKSDEHAGHFRRYSKKSISEVVERAGFQVVELSCFFTFLYFPILIMRSIPSKLGISRVERDTTSRDHVPRNNAISRVVRWILNGEFRSLKNGKRKKIGSSIILVARKL